VDFTNLCHFSLQNREPYIISIGQFRPEKNHRLQLEAFKLFLENYDRDRQTKLVIIGSVRQQEDQKRLDNLKQQAVELGIKNEVIFAPNITVDDLKNWLQRASIGLHTMSFEHFGIGVVEFMAAGLVPVAHNSAGPKEDIVVPYKKQRTGFLAISVEEYADHLGYIFSHPEEIQQIRKSARASVSRFSDESFSKEFIFILQKFSPLKSIFTKPSIKKSK